MLIKVKNPPGGWFVPGIAAFFGGNKRKIQADKKGYAKKDFQIHAALL